MVSEMAKRIVIASGKGGVGKSSVCAGLACALQKAGHNVLVVDCDIGLRSLDIILSAQANMLFTWGDIISGRCSGDEALTATAYGPSLLCAPGGFEDCFTAEAMRRMADEYEERFDYILFDSPAGIGQGLGLAGAAADSAIIVATPDSVCVRSGAIAADRLSKLGIKNSRLVINRFDKRAIIKGKLLNIDDVIDSTRQRLIGIVPQDNSIMYNMTSGKPLPGKSAAAAFGRIAARLDGKRVPLQID